MCACGFEVACHGDIVFQVVFGALGVENIARVADRRFADLAAFAYGVHRDAHVFNPIQAIEDAEHIDAGAGGLCHEGLHDVVGVIGVANAV